MGSHHEEEHTGICFHFYIYLNYTCCMGFRIILNDFMKIVCGLKTGGASAVDGVIVTKTSLLLDFLPL